MHRSIVLIAFLLLPGSVFGQTEKPLITGQDFLVNGISSTQTGIGSVTLELIFNREMDTNPQLHPQVFFSLDSSFTLPLPITGFWVGDSIWQGIFSVSENMPPTGNGFYNFRFHGAKSAAGVVMDTTFGLQQLHICRPELLTATILNFADTAPGFISTDTLIIQNISCAAITIDSLKTATPFSIATSANNQTIAAGDSLKITLRFSPLSRQAFAADLHIVSTQLSQQSMNVRLTGSAPGPSLSIDRVKLNFGSVELGQDSTQRLTIYNIPAADPAFDADLHFELTVQPDQVIFSPSPVKGDILPGDSLKILLTFRPQEVRSYDNYILRLTANDGLQPEKQIELSGDTESTPSTSISNLQVQWGDIYPGHINTELLQICWENPGGGNAQIRWKFTTSAAPPLNNDDLDKGGVLNLSANQQCASISLAALGQGRWYGYFWLVDAAGNSGYQDYMGINFKYDRTSPAVPLLVQSNILPGTWISTLDSVEVKLKLAPSAQVHLLDVARVYIKFNSPPEDGGDFMAWSGVGSVQNGIAAFRFKFDPVACGPGTIYFWSSDSAGNYSDINSSLALDYRTDTCPPTISGIANTNVISAVFGRAFRDTVHVKDERDVKRVWIEYRAAGSAEVKTNDNTRRIFGSDDFIVSIPQNEVTLRGLEYRILAQDSTDLISFAVNQNSSATDSGWVALPTYVSGKGTSPMDEAGNELPLIAGSDSTDYQLISIPLELVAPQIDSVFADDLGDYKVSKWRLFDYDTKAPAGQRWLEGDSARPFAPGRSYFIISRSNMKFDTGRGKTRRTLCPDSIEVFEGWNLVATPFNFTVDLRALSLVNSNSPVILYPYDAGWEFSSIMQPWLGYAIFVRRADNAPVNAPMYLVVEPQEAPTTATATKIRPATVAGGSATEWSIKISATAGRSRDLHNWVGVRQMSKAGFDDLERAEPPLIGRYVSVSFHHPEWRQITDRFSTDFRSPGADQFVWEVDIRSNARNETVQLAFEFDENVPENLSVFLIDEQQQRMQDLRSNPRYEFLTVTKGSKKVKLVVGTESFVREVAGEITSLPQQFALLQNFPNPFNPETTVRFNLPRNGLVQIAVFNQLGQQVASLANDVEMAAGYHSIFWQARDARGQILPSGIYFVRMLFAGEIAVTKAVLLR